jgi:hypothetical protein
MMEHGSGGLLPGGAVSGRADDIIYVANAPLNELQKFSLLINTVTGPVISGVVVSRSVGAP